MKIKPLLIPGYKASVYEKPLAEAKECGELELWRENLKLNILCRDYIENSIKTNYDGMHLRAHTAADLCAAFGRERVGWILANTVRNAEWDGQEWARGVGDGKIPERISEFCLRSHPEIVNGLINQFRRFEKETAMHMHEECVPDSKTMDYTDRLLIISPSWFNENSQYGYNQYFLAQGGFGCSPTALGTKVFGAFLYDGEQVYLERADFMGIADPDKLPAWVKDKMDSLAETTVTEQNNDGGIDIE